MNNLKSLGAATLTAAVLPIVLLWLLWQLAVCVFDVIVSTPPQCKPPEDE